MSFKLEFAVRCCSCFLLCTLLPSNTFAQQSDAGRNGFKRCANCHQVGPNAHSNFGPQLNGIVGRRAGSLPDYAYSPAMKQAGFAWDEGRLAAFIRDPDAVVPGTRMRFWSFMSERQARDIVAYLRSFPAPAAAPARR